MSWFLEPWSLPFMRWALVCCLVLAGVHAYLGFHVVRRGVLFVDLAMAQMAALGAAVGVVFGLEHGTTASYVISLSFALAGSVVFATLRSRVLHQETLIAIFYAIATALTFVVLEHSPHGMDEVKHLFVGQVLTVDPSKVLWTALLYSAIGLVLARLNKRLLAVTEGRERGRGKLDLVFYGAFAVVVTSSVSLVGVLLVFGLLVLPSVAALLLPGRDGSRLAWGWIFAGLGCLGGLHAAYHLDQPASPIIVVCLAVLLVGAAVLGRLRSGRGDLAEEISSR
ncbi:MAG: metal ABC transporter permease [Gemmatimonadetes bacterium]|nr:metal ABC transporter permease [Gemmatimonadota bacterium]